MPLTVDTVWRDYATGGVPSSGPHKPVKSEIRDLLRPMEAAVSSFLSNGGLVYATKLLLFGNTTAVPNQMAWVILDPVVANNGIYQKQPSGTWARVADLPYDFILASDAGAGSANNIIATSLLPISVGVLVSFTVFETTTATPVTVTFNGASPLTIKTATGSDPAPGGLTAGMALLGLHQGAVFRLLSDQASAAIQAAAEAAQAAAEDARDLAIQAADQAAIEGAGDVPTYPSRALAQAATIPVNRTYIWTAGYADAGDGGASLYRRVAADPAHPYKVRSVDRFMPDGSTNSTNGGWWEGRSKVLSPKMFGAPNNGTDHDDAALRDLGTTLQAGKAKRVMFEGAYRIYQNEASVTAGPIIILDHIDGITFEFHNATFTCTFDQSALISAANWARYAFAFYSCRNFRGIGRPKFIGNWTKETIKSFSSAFGVIGLAFENDCTGVTLDGVDGQGILCPIYLVNDTLTTRFRSETPIIAAPGTGYAVGNVLTIDVGGPGSSPATINVNAIDGSGGVTHADFSGLGMFPTLPPVIGTNKGYAPTGGSGSGVRIVAPLERGRTDEHTQGGNVGYVSARECFYAHVQRNSGDAVTAVVNAEYCYRAAFTYGAIRSARTFVTFRHGYRTQIIYGGAFHGLGNEDHYFHIKMLPATEGGYSLGDCICRNVFFSRNPTRVDVHLDVDLEYGRIAGRAANFFELAKYTDGTPDPYPRGHQNRLKWTGIIKGKSDIDAFAQRGTHMTFNSFPSAGEYFYDWQIGPLNIAGGGYIDIDPTAFPASPNPAEVIAADKLVNGGIHFDVVMPDGYVMFNNGIGGTRYKETAYAQVPVSVSPRSHFRNRFGRSDLGSTWPACIGCIDEPTDTLTLQLGWHDWIIKPGTGTGSVANWTLPANPPKGLRFRIENTAYFTGVIRLRPQAGDKFFLAAAVGKYLQLDNGESAIVECGQNGLDPLPVVWHVVGSTGTLSYEP